MPSSLAVLESSQCAVIANVGCVWRQAENHSYLGASEHVPVDEPEDLLIREGKPAKCGGDISAIDVATRRCRREFRHHLNGDYVVPLAQGTSMVSYLKAPDS